KSAQIREILISESAWEEMTCLFAPSLAICSFNANRFFNFKTLPLHLIEPVKKQSAERYQQCQYLI
ncbi:hypothetical protein KJK00_05670, partial [Klebsiella quasipneumoniae]|nr:hypothetical protein [Klebsiella quasipneumoniae]